MKYLRTKLDTAVLYRRHSYRRLRSYRSIPISLLESICSRVTHTCSKTNIVLNFYRLFKYHYIMHFLYSNSEDKLYSTQNKNLISSWTYLAMPVCFIHSSCLGTVTLMTQHAETNGDPTDRHLTHIDPVSRNF